MDSPRTLSCKLLQFVAIWFQTWLFFMENLPHRSFFKGYHGFSWYYYYYYYYYYYHLIHINLQEVCKRTYIQRALPLICFCPGVARTSDTVARSERLAAFAHSVAKVSAQNRKTQRDWAGTGAVVWCIPWMWFITWTPNSCDLYFFWNSIHLPLCPYPKAPGLLGSIASQNLGKKDLWRS